ncbi:T9SS type A sorting domain-containing protein [Yeosuana sp. AK3]
MKKITFLFTFLFMISIGFAQNLLSGGDLEGLTTGKIIPGSSPWDTSVAGSAAQSSINNNSSVAHAGDQFINMPNDFTNFRQSFTATAGTEYTLSFWYNYIMGQGQITDPDDGMFISVRQDTGGNGTQFDPIISIYLDPTTVTPDTWNQASINFIAPQANLLLFVTKQARSTDGDGGLNNAARMDDFSIEPTPPLSVNDLTQFNFKSYPNPANDFIKLSAEKNINKIEVYNLLGQQVKSELINRNEAEVNISSLSKGVYLVKAFIDDAEGTYKFVKQ